MQERPESGFDRLGFGSWSRESQQEVVGIPDIAKPSVVWVGRIARGERLKLLAQLPGCRSSSGPSQLAQAFAASPVG
jgi:hypothetical protein